VANLERISKTKKTLWQRFGNFVKDPRVKVIVYPVGVVLAVILAAFGNFLWTEYGPGDLTLAVQVNDETGNGVKGATVGFEPSITGGHYSLPTDALGGVSFKIPHANMDSNLTLNVAADNYQTPADPPSLVLGKKNQKTIKLQKIAIAAPPAAQSPAQMQPSKPTLESAKRAEAPKKGLRRSARPLQAKLGNAQHSASHASQATEPEATVAKAVQQPTVPPAEMSPPLPDWIYGRWGLEVKDKRFTLAGQSLHCAATVDQSLAILRSKSQNSFVFNFEQSIESKEQDIEKDIKCTDLADTKTWDVSVPITLSEQGQGSLLFTAAMEKCHGSFGMDRPCKIPGGRERLSGTIRHISDDQIEVSFPESLQGTFVLTLGQ
jgi:hypothetical protein